MRFITAIALAAGLALATGAQASITAEDTLYDRPQQDREFYRIFGG